MVFTSMSKCRSFTASLRSVSDNPDAAGVRFAESASLPSPPAAAARAIAAHTDSITLACGPEVLDIKFGFLLLSGIYTTDLTLDWPVPGGQQQQRQHPAGSAATPPPQVRGLTASNLSVAVEPGAAPGQQRLVLRLWADREGPFEERFALGLPPGQEVRQAGTARGPLHVPVPALLPSRDACSRICQEPWLFPAPACRRWRCASPPPSCPARRAPPA